MKLGYSSNPRTDVLAEIKWIAEQGFDYIDLCLEPDKAAAELVDAERIRDALKVSGLDVVGHLAWYLPTGSPMPQLRRAAVSAAADYLKVLARIGVRAVTVHASWPSSMFGIDHAVAWQLDALRGIVDVARELELLVMYEPIGTRFDGVENIEKILDGLPELLLHLDIGHCNLAGRDPETMIRHFGDRIYHLHLHDNDGVSDLHLPPGTGKIDWPAVIRALKDIGYDRTVTLEVFSPDRDYVLLAKRKIERLLAEA